MQVLAAILRRLVALRDFWRYKIQTYTYINLHKSTPQDTSHYTQEKHSTTTNKAQNYNGTLKAHHGTIQAMTTKDTNPNQTTSFSAQDSQFSTPNQFNPPQTLDSSQSPNQSTTDSATLNQATPNFTSLQACAKQKFITLAQLTHPTPKAHKLAQFLYHKESMRTYYCVLPINCLVGAQITIERAQLQREQTPDSIILSQAQAHGLIPSNHEYRYFVQQLGSTLSFQVFCVDEALLQQYAARYSGTLLCLNPLEICCALSTLFPTLTRYTIIFQDTHKHALCHYRDGALMVSIVLERKEALQNYYHLIDDFGRIFYCDLSGDAALLRDFQNITTLFGAPLSECFHILALHHIHTKPISTHFCAQRFYAMRTKIKTLFGITCAGLALYCAHFYYNAYQYHQFMQQQDQNYQNQIESLYHKKQSYPSMYERIYEQLLENQSLNFCLRQDYNDANKWESYPCTPR